MLKMKKAHTWLCSTAFNTMMHVIQNKVRRVSVYTTLTHHDNRNKI